MMMMNIRKQRLAIAVAGTFSLLGSMAQAAEFSATTDLQNTLAVTVISPLDIGSIFAAKTGVNAAAGLGAMTIAADGTVDNTLSSATVKVLSLGTPVPAQGSVDSTADFTLQLPDTSGYDESEWSDGTGTNLVAEFITTIGTTGLEATELRVSADESIPALYLVHFTVADAGDTSDSVTERTGAGTYDGIWDVDMGFGETTFVFNIGATVVTQPGQGTALNYEEGTYSGTFEVTAAY